jgi:hypothetical protein
MKRLIFLLLFSLPCYFLFSQLDVDVKGKVENEADNRVNGYADDAVRL